MNDEERWWETDENVQTMLDFMAEQASYSKADMAYAHAKPWKFREAYEAGKQYNADMARVEAAKVPGWNGAGSDVDGVDYEVGRG